MFAVTIIAWITAALCLFWSIAVLILVAIEPDTDPQRNRDNLAGVRTTLALTVFFGMLGWIAVALAVIGILAYIAVSIWDLFKKHI